jgi:DeoR/GlpR family transcriptional regulator of sugar metabolism
MSFKNRLNRIVSLVNEHGYLSVSELSRRCNISEITIRRDLIRLDNEKRVKRTHGGAAALQSTPDWSSLSAPVESNTDSNLDRFKAVILTCVETRSENELIDMLTQREIPVIAESVPSPKAAITVATDNEQAAFDLGQMIGRDWQVNNKRRVSLLDFTYPLPNTQSRSRGFLKGLQDALGYSPPTLVMNSQSKEENAYQLTLDALRTNPQINLIFTVHDAAAVGAIRACHEAGISGDQVQVAAFGLEGSPIRQALADGKYCRFALATFPEIAGTLCMDAAFNTINQIPQPAVITTPSVVLTTRTLHKYYYPSTAGWKLRPEKWNEIMQTLPQVKVLPVDETAPKLRIGFTLRFRFHDWYQSLVKAMHARANELGLELEVIDADLTVQEELEQMERKIASRALQEIQPGQTVLLDGGSICELLAEMLEPEMDVTIVTNSLPIIQQLQTRGDVHLVVPGGNFKPGYTVLCGSAAESALRSIHVDLFFLEAAGISSGFGVSENNITIANLKRAMIQWSEKTVMLAPHPALGLKSQIQVAPIQAIHTLITGSAMPASLRSEIVRQGIEVVLVN